MHKLVGKELLLVWAEALEANPEMSIVEIATVSGDDLPGDLRDLAEQFARLTHERDVLFEHLRATIYIT